MKNNEEIKADLKNKFNNNSNISNNIFFREEKDEQGEKIVIELFYESVLGNMQNTECAFEGCAIAIRYVYDEKKVELRVINKTDRKERSYNITRYISDNSKDLHFNRFLYRAMKFRGQYKWFKLSKELDTAVNKFEDYFNNIDICSNYPTQEASDTPKKIEGLIERYYEKNPEELRNEIKITEIGEEVHRQLPVCIFEGEKDGHKALFPKNHSAIDLWSVNGQVIDVIELKAEYNDDIGIISEIFFYANYVYDLCVTRRFRFNKDLKKYFRGYEKLGPKDKYFQKVNAIMLAPKYSPYVTENTLRILNEGNNRDQIEYYIKTFEQKNEDFYKKF